MYRVKSPAGLSLRCWTPTALVPKGNGTWDRSDVRLEWKPSAIAVVTIMGRSENRRTHEASGKTSSARGRGLVLVLGLRLVVLCMCACVNSRNGRVGRREKKLRLPTPDLQVEGGVYEGEASFQRGRDGIFECGSRRGLRRRSCGTDTLLVRMGRLAGAELGPRPRRYSVGLQAVPYSWLARLRRAARWGRSGEKKNGQARVGLD